MSEIKKYAVKEHIGSTALMNNDQYEAMYKRSIEDSEGFWAEQGKRIGPKCIIMDLLSIQIDRETHQSSTECTGQETGKCDSKQGLKQQGA